MGLLVWQQFPAKFDNIAATTPFLKKAVRKPKFKALVQQGLGTLPGIAACLVCGLKAGNLHAEHRDHTA
jgi:hypothetical protein